MGPPSPARSSTRSSADVSAGCSSSHTAGTSDRESRSAACCARPSTSPKHFPGHGATTHDTHHTTVDVIADRATLERRELVPFRAAIAAGASSIMTAHVRYPALDDESIATLSPRILGDLLRRELGFT